MQRLLLLSIFLLTFHLLHSQNRYDNAAVRKTATALRTDHAPRINGVLDDEAWASASVINDFRQLEPLYNQPVTFLTEVRILYDDYAVYVGALMHDPHPDSILMQLGNRDDDNLNADIFGVEFDTYNNQLDAYTFRVTSSGVQLDFREHDETYNGVWLSSAKRNNEGWVAEMMIPYSALRFPKTEVQRWGFQMMRSIRRYREKDQFALEKPGAENDLVYWGELLGISHISPPVRLSLTPYLSCGLEHYPQTGQKSVSTTFGGGTDLKYGINESYTIDMTLLPDFSQVQSDNKIKNLSAFETVYSEQRPFFREAVDLFNKGDIFYSRRIGKTPAYFYNATDMAGEGYELTRNPVQQHLLNAFKVSGRGKKGLALGFLNAVTGNTYAEAKNAATGEKKRILTDAATNYNVVVFDQALPYNSDLYLVNTNVIRGKGFRDANVTAAGIQLNDRKNVYLLNLNGGVSQLFEPDTIRHKTEISAGYKYYAGVSKVNGHLQWMALHGKMDKGFDANDLGTTLYNNYTINMAQVSYSLYEPWWKLRDWHNELTLENTNNAQSGLMQATSLEFNSFSTLMNYLTLWCGLEYKFANGHDYYEARLPDRYFIQPSSIQANIGFSSDYRNPFALDGSAAITSARQGSTLGYMFELEPIARINNHLLLNYSFTYEKMSNEIGFATLINNTGIIFGKRDVLTLENKLSGRYMIRNNMSLNLVARHYWSQGVYSNYYTLGADGLLTQNQEYIDNNNFTFNAFNIDFSFLWLFKPGCRVNITWKNTILTESNETNSNYIENFGRIFDDRQQNNLTFKIIYYLDYQNLKRAANKEKNHY
ncbi:MAG TPA: DUF5916 domain-containing protein [Bacteroidales bacterium]|nr:DUF5916 domain-containing protein [Bacteroidales bacterium]